MKDIKLKKNHIKKINSIQENYKGRPVGYIIQYLASLGINRSWSFIDKPTDEDFEAPINLDNIERAVKVAHDELDAGAKVFDVVDSDTDGFTSSAILISYIKRRWPQNSVTWRLHPGKEHGVVVDDVPVESTLVFIPDAGSNQFKEHRELALRGKTIIVLDHHEIDEMDEYYKSPAIIVNNQCSSRFKNKSLSGAGVVYKFIELMDRTYFSGNPIYQEYADLAAIGIIADAMSMNTLDNNYIAYHGLNNINNKFIQHLAAAQSRGIKDPTHLTKIDVAFYIAPVINGVIRGGTQEDKESVFNAMVNNNDGNLYEHNWRGSVKMETLYQKAVRLATNAKSRQDNNKKKSFENLCGKIERMNLNSHNILIVPLDTKESESLNPNFTGLVAMELCKKYNKPTLLLRTTTDATGKVIFAGSGRNGNFYGLRNLKTTINTVCGLVAQGHEGAFGVTLTRDQIDQLTQYFDANINAAIFDDKVYEVDYWFRIDELLDSMMLMQFAYFNKLWGNSIPAPKFAVDFDYCRDNIRVMGEKKDSMKISYGGADFVMFKCREIIDQLTSKDYGHITVIGMPSINNWNGKDSLQMIIEDIDVYEQSKDNQDLEDLINSLL